MVSKDPSKQSLFDSEDCQVAYKEISYRSYKPKRQGPAHQISQERIDNQIHMATKLFVGNLTYNSTENDLQDYFSQAGTVISVNIMQDRTTGRSRGFAFIEMGSPAEATKAIAMFHQKDFQGRPLTVNEARPRESRPPGGGGGGGGYGGGGSRERRGGGNEYRQRR